MACLVHSSINRLNGLYREKWVGGWVGEFFLLTMFFTESKVRVDLTPPQTK